MVVNKFGKLCGPGAESVPTANSVTSAKIFDGGVEAADLGALSVTAAKLGVDVAGDGLAGGNGAAISLDIDNLTDAVLDVAADTICFIDESAAGDPTKLESVADLVTAVAGTVATSALTATSGVLKVAPADAGITVGADSLVFATAAGVTKKDLVSDVASAMSDGTTITASSGVFSVKTSSLGIAQMANDDKASIFVVYGEHDFSANTAKDTDFGALGAKGTLIGGSIVMTQALNGTDASTIIKIGTAAAGATPIAHTMTITKANTADGQSNVPGYTFGLNQLAAGIDIASTTHIYAYTPADGGASTRSAGKAWIKLFFQKSA